MTKKIIYLAGGCFWGLEKAFQSLNGVTNTEVGYANGKTTNPTYEEVCGNETGFKETVKIEYDDDKLSLNKILDAFFICIDPTLKNRQGNDIGTQYQTGIYYLDDNKEDVIKYVNEKKKDYPIFYTEVEKLDNYYPAEEYHQDYLIKNPNGYCHISLKEIEEIKKLNEG